MLRGSHDVYHQGLLEEFKKYRNTAGVKLTREERESERASKFHMIESNHKLRDMLQNQRDNFTRQQLGAWYSRFLNRDQGMADHMIMGVMAEIAVGEAAADMTDALEVVTWGSVDDDAIGGDIIGRVAGSLEPVRIDVKAGRQLPIGREDQTGIQLIIGVPDAYFDRHGRVDSEGREGLQRAIAMALQACVKPSKKRKSA